MCYQWYFLFIYLKFQCREVSHLKIMKQKNSQLTQGKCQLSSSWIDKSQGFDVNLQGVCLISVLMQSQKNGPFYRKILFIVQGKLSPSNPCQAISGKLKIMDSSNLAIITGSFEQGFCPNAEISSLNSAILRNIAVQIKSDGFVYMGGDSVQQVQMGQLEFQGGYRCYQRYGYGRTQEMVNGRYYDQHCLWNCRKEMGIIVKQHLDNEEKVTHMVITNNDAESFEERMVYLKNGKYYQKVEKKNGKQKQVQISKEQFQRFVQEGLKLKQKMINIHKQTNYLCSVKEYPLKWMRYDLQALEYAKKSRLNYDLCEVYLQYLFCNQQYHQTTNNAILSLNLADYLQQRSQNMSIDAKISILMQTYKKPYSILGGFWKKIIFPLVLTDINKHFSFAVIEFEPIRCTFYDSASYKHTNIYQKIIKAFLLQQAQTINRDKNDIEKMVFQIEVDFPKQNDDVSCGYFMLQGIQDIMKHGKVIFKSENLPTIKSKILNKLHELTAL